MTKPGRKPMSTQLKILTGNKRYINTKEPKPEPLKSLKPPDWLPESVHKQYKEFATKLIGLGVLKETDVMTYNLMFLHLAITIEAAENLSEEELSVTDNRRVKRKNVNLQILRDNSLAFLRYSELYGLDPSSRQRINVDSKDLDISPMAKLWAQKLIR